MRDDDEDLFDERGVMRRNGTFTVPVTLMDSVQRAVADDPLTGDTARDEYIRDLGDAWRTPPATQSAAGNSQPPVSDARADYIAALSNAWRGVQP